MKMEDIVKDALKYPFSGWKKFFILGILIVIPSIIISHTYPLYTLNTTYLSILLVANILITFLNRGYQFRMIKDSFNDTVVLPEFNYWGKLFIDGVKLVIVGVVFFIPIILFNLFFYILPYPQIIHLMLTDPGIVFSIKGSFSFLYLIAIIPILTIAIGNMAWNGGEFYSAFRFKEILNRIHMIGWTNLITWCIVIGLIQIIITYAVTFVINIIFRGLVPHIIILTIYAFIFVTYLEMFLSRSVALIYMSNTPIKYLICEECGGYYELQPGESPEDYEQCQCGGKLKYSKLIPSDNKSDNFDKFDDNNEEQRSIINFDKRRNLMIIILLALAIIAIPILIYSTHALTPTPANYTLLGSYNATNLSPHGTAVNIPQGTKNIKIDYNINWKAVPKGSNGFDLDAYDVNASEIQSGAQNFIGNKGFLLKEGQNKTGTYYFNNPQIKSLSMTGNGIQGTIKIYTSK